MKKSITKLTGSGLGLLLLTPVLAFAQVQAQGGLGDINAIVDDLGTIVDSLIPIAFGLIVVVFFWGLAKYVLNADNEDAKDKGKRIMIGGVIALFIAASIWGIVIWIGDILGVDTEQGSTTAPDVKGIGNTN